MAPLSGKQHREYLKFQNKEAREASKMGLDEMRKQQLHQIKLQEAAAKANQGLGHKEQVNNARLKEMGIPLPKGASINKQKLGIPSTNPMAGTGMFKQGQHRLSQSPIFKAQGTDTVPAMLTPGEAVIPEPAAQNPKNKKAIKRMVQEGRKANRLRDGAVNVVNSDAPAQARYHADGTSGVPSLAYRHPDVPGSSFMNGTMSVPDFKRGSSAQANYANGTYGVVPQQVQSAVGYQEGTLDADIDEERKRQGVVPMIIQPASTETIPIWDERRAAEGDQFANMVAVDNRPMREIPMVSAVSTPVADQTPSNAVITLKEVPPVVLDTTPNLVAPAVSTVPAMFADQVQAAPVTNVAKPVAPLAVAPDQLNKEELAGLDVVNTQNIPATVTSAVPTTTTTPTVPFKVDPYAGIEPTRREHYETDPVKAARKIRSVSEIVEELAGKQKTEKSFTDSLANLFTASGFKEELGLNNQDIIRMAISTAVGAKKFGVNRALAYAGKQAFEDSNKRNAQAQAESKAIRTAAVQIRGQEIRDVRQEENAAAAENRAILRENARREHDRFIAAQQTKMAEIKDEYNRTRDANRFEQQMRIMASQQSQQDKRMQAMFGNQWAMMFAREDLKDNNPRAKLERMEKHTNQAASAVTEIYKRDLGSEDIKDQPNPARANLPTPKQATQQSLSFLKNSGFDITDTDVAQEASAIINQATEQMIADKKSGRVTSVSNIAPYLSANVIKHRLGQDPQMFSIGDKPMAPEKITEIYGLARRLATDSSGKVEERNIAAGVNRIAEDWAKTGKQERDRFPGTKTETAYSQYLKSRLSDLVKEKEKLK